MPVFTQRAPATNHFAPKKQRGGIFTGGALEPEAGPESGAETPAAAPDAYQLYRAGERELPSAAESYQLYRAGEREAYEPPSPVRVETPEEERLRYANLALDPNLMVSTEPAARPDVGQLFQSPALRFARAAAEAATLGGVTRAEREQGVEVPKAETFGEKAVEFAGAVVGGAAPYAIASPAAGLVTRPLAHVLSRLGPVAGQAANVALREGLASFGVGTAEALGEGKPLPEALSRGGLTAAVAAPLAGTVSAVAGKLAQRGAAEQAARLAEAQAMRAVEIENVQRMIAARTAQADRLKRELDLLTAPRGERGAEPAAAPSVFARRANATRSALEKAQQTLSLLQERLDVAEVSKPRALATQALRANVERQRQAIDRLRRELDLLTQAPGPASRVTETADIFTRRAETTRAALETAQQEITALQERLAALQATDDATFAAMRAAEGKLQAAQAPAPPAEGVAGHISVGETRPGPTARQAWDAVATKFIDQLAPLQRAVRALSGGADVPVTADPFKQATLARGWVGKVQTWLNYGIMDKNYRKVGPSLREVLEPVADRLDDFRRYLVARRALELETRGIETGITHAQARADVTRFDSPLFRRAAERLVEFQDAVLQQLVDSGVIGQESVDAMRVANRYYVPFFRQFEESGGKLQDFLKRGFANLGEGVHKIVGSERKIIDPLESIVKNAFTMTQLAEHNRVGRLLVEMAEAHPERAAGIMQKVDEASSSLKNILTIRRGGQIEHWQVLPELYESMLALDSEAGGALVKLLSYASIPTRTLRAGATLSPGFIARNPAKDQFTAFVQSKYGFVPGVDFVRGLFHVLGKTELYNQWKAAGGAQSALVSLDRNYLQGALRDIIKQRASKNPLEWLRALSEFFEEGTRMGEFARGVAREGATREGIQKAALASREVTLDFARSGSWGRTMNNLSAFWNAQVQGVDKMARMFRESPVGTTARAATIFTLPTIYMYAVNRRNPEYWKLPQWERDAFWLIPFDGGKKFVRVPKGIGLMGVLFATFPERVMQWIDKQDPRAFDEFGRRLWENVNPGGIPTAFEPWIEIVSNENFAGAPIVPKREETLEPAAQYGPRTSLFAKTAGGLVNASPRQIDHVVRGYLGGLGRLGTDIIDIASEAAGLESGPPKPARKISELPIAREFVSDTSRGNYYVDAFYQTLEELERRAATAKIGRAKPLTMREAMNLRGLRQTADRLSELRAQRRKIEEGAGGTPEQRRARLERIDAQMSDATLARLRAIGKGGKR